MSRRKFLLFLLSAIILITASVFICDRVVDRAAANRLYSSVDSIPANKVGLLLGTSKYLGSKDTLRPRLNPYYRYRIDAALALLRAGKIRYIIVSGDNGRKEYDEPDQMRRDLIEAGIDSNLIYCDYAGFRTFDSIVRLKKIFGQTTATIISQPFHNERALYIAQQEGIAAIGFNARDLSDRLGLKVQVREKFARVKLFLDLLFNKQPKFLGPRVPIPE